MMAIPTNVWNLGFEEIVAVELLLQNNVANIRAENLRNRRENVTRDFVNVTIPEARVNIEQIDVTEYKDDDEENRMIEDTNVLDEGGFITHEDKKSKNDNKNGQVRS